MANESFLLLLKKTPLATHLLAFQGLPCSTKRNQGPLHLPSPSDLNNEWSLRALLLPMLIPLVSIPQSPYSLKEYNNLKTSAIQKENPNQTVVNEVVSVEGTLCDTL